jgi:hypothetical protein
VRGPRSRVPDLDAELVLWIHGEADRRVCHPRVILEGAVRLLREAIDAAPDLVDLPSGPIGERPQCEPGTPSSSTT